MNRFKRGAANWALALVGVVAGCRFAGDDVPATRPPMEFVGGSTDIFPPAFRVVGLAGFYKEVFQRMREPSLWGARIPEGTTMLRMVWFRSFDPTVVIRITETPERCVVSTAIDGVGVDELGAPDVRPPGTANHYGPLLRRDSSDLDLDLCARLHTHFVAARLWSGPVTSPVAGFDGDEVVFEHADASGYHIASRWTPGRGRSPEFREVWAWFIGVANVNPEEFKKGVW